MPGLIVRVIFEQPKKAFVPKIQSLDNVTFLKLVHELNTDTLLPLILIPILVTDDGITILVNLVQPTKQLLPLLLFPKLVRDDGNNTSVKLVKKLKDEISLIDELPLASNANDTFVITLEILLKGLPEILVTVDGIITTGGPLFELYEEPVIILLLEPL